MNAEREAFLKEQERILKDKWDRYTQKALHLPPGEINPHTLGKITTSAQYIQRALDRIADGTYGTCEDCGSDIPMKRLKIVPGATRCVACESNRRST